MSLLLRRRMLLSQQKKSSNLFDIDKFVENANALGVTDLYVKKIDNGVFLRSFPYGEQKTRIDFGFEPNKQYTISLDCETVMQETEGKGSCMLIFYYEDDTTTTKQIAMKNVGYFQTTEFTSNVGKNVVAFAVGNWGYSGAFNFTNIMLNEGTIALPYEPF